MKSIYEIESELKSLLDSDQKNWVHIYQLINEVDVNNLWEGKFKSFTQWIRHLAEVCNVHESLIWTRNKAGKVYYQYQERKKSQNKAVADITEIKVSPDNLVLIEKIAQGNAAVQDDLIDKTVKGELKRADLKNAWATVKAEKESKGESATRTNAHQQFKETKEKSTRVTAKDFTLALQKSDWIKQTTNNIHIRHVYETITEFAVKTGTSRNARRIDALVLENINLNSADEINLHGIEIKVEKSDLLNDHKTSEYEDFVDYLYFAVPEELVEDAKNVARDGWGILTLSSGKVKIIKSASRNEAVFRDKTMATALVKKLKVWK